MLRLGLFLCGYGILFCALCVGLIFRFLIDWLTEGFLLVGALQFLSWGIFFSALVTICGGLIVKKYERVSSVKQ